MDVARQKSDLQRAEVALQQAMADLTQALSEVSDRRKEVEEVKREVTQAESETQERQAHITSELNRIIPILNSAQQAVGKISSDHLNELRSMHTPPEAIVDVLSAVLMLLGVNDHSWLSIKSNLTTRVIGDIMNFNGERITEELRREVSKHIKKKAQSFDPSTISRVSAAAAPLAAWVKANIQYSLVLERIQPLKLEFAEAKVVLERSQQRLQACEAELIEIDQRVQRLMEELGQQKAEASMLTTKLENTNTTLGKAQHLIGQLGEEQSRWEQQSKTLHAEVQTLPLQALLAAAFCTYLGKVSEDIRASMRTIWQEAAGVHKFTLRGLLSSESQLLAWKFEGLPSDTLSQEIGRASCRERVL